MYPNQAPAATHQPTTPIPAAPRPSAPMPPTHAGWAVAAVIFFWPLAFAAFNHSSRVTGLWLSGDHVGAQEASDRARSLGKIAVVVCAVLTAAIIALYVLAIAAAVTSPGVYY